MVTIRKTLQPGETFVIGFSNTQPSDMYLAKNIIAINNYGCVLYTWAQSGIDHTTAWLTIIFTSKLLLITYTSVQMELSIPSHADRKVNMIS